MNLQTIVTKCLHSSMSTAFELRVRVHWFKSDAVL